MHIHPPTTPPPRSATQGSNSNVHEWTFFVKMDPPGDETRFLERVIVRLHPTFNPSTVNLTDPPFSVRRHGWGMFVVVAIVFFRPEWDHEPLVLHWSLDFEGEGGGGGGRQRGGRRGGG